jgi:hypothetical protein
VLKYRVYSGLNLRFKSLILGFEVNKGDAHDDDLSSLFWFNSYLCPVCGHMY